jgi:hypothetical protein
MELELHLKFLLLLSILFTVYNHHTTVILHLLLLINSCTCAVELMSQFSIVKSHHSIGYFDPRKKWGKRSPSLSHCLYGPTHMGGRTLGPVEAWAPTQVLVLAICLQYIFSRAPSRHVERPPVLWLFPRSPSKHC